MLKKMSIRKIMVSTLTLFILLIIYLMPDSIEEKEINLKNDNVEYIYSNTLETVYLLDSNDFVARTKIDSCNCDGVDKAKDLLEGLIVDGKKSNIIPNGFRPIIPSGTSIKNVNLDNGVLTVDFSKELLEISKDYEEKMIESIIYTLTSIDGIDKVKITVEGSPLEKLPISGKSLPTYLSKDYGINKIYDISTTRNIDSYTLYYVNTYNDNSYYVPVTKYINNDSQDKIKVIIEELSSAPVYETTLMSFLNDSTKLLDYELNDNQLILNFNEGILSDATSNNILEEVIYTISLSMNDNYDVDEIVFKVENEEIYKSLIKNIE